MANAIQDLTYQVYDFAYSKRRDQDLQRFIDFLVLNKIDYSVAYNGYKRDSIQLTVNASLTELAMVEYCLNNGMII